jgi:hypothetical protein
MGAIERLKPSATPYVASRLGKVRNQMLNGYNFGAALFNAGTGWPDQKMNLIIDIFAETQDLSAQPTKLAKSWVDVSQENITMSMGIVGGVYSLQDQIAQSVNAH